MSVSDIAGQTLSVMLLCGDRKECDHISAMLVSDQNSLSCAENLDEAMEYLESGFIDVAILCHTPELSDAFKASNALRRRSGSLQTIIVGDVKDEQHLQCALDAGAAAYLTRPLDPELLAAALGHCGLFSSGLHGSACPTCEILNADTRHGVLQIDVQGKIRFINAAAAQHLQCAVSPEVQIFQHLVVRSLCNYREYMSDALLDAVAECRHWNGLLAGTGKAGDSVFECEVFPLGAGSRSPGCTVIIRDITVAAKERDRLVFERGVASDLNMMHDTVNSETKGESVFKPAAVIEQAFISNGMTSLKLYISSALQEYSLYGGREQLEIIFGALARHLHSLKGLRGLLLQISIKEKRGSDICLLFQLTAESSAIAVNSYDSVSDYISAMEKPDGSGLLPAGIFLAASRVAETGDSFRVKRMAGEKIDFSFCLRMKTADTHSESTQPSVDSLPGSARILTSLKGRLRKEKMRILVADDSLSDQLGIRAMIEKAGHDNIVFVGNGREAVEEFEQGDYDLVFMDILMPVMDGFEATRLIRRQEHLTGTYTPVIALTSYSLKAVHDKCISVGMDGYLSKPVNRNDINFLFAQLLSDAVPQPAAPEIIQQASELPVLDTIGILNNYGDDIELYQTIANIFEPQAEPVIAELEEALAAGDAKAAGPAAHKLKGIASAMGGIRISELLRTIDEAAQTGTDMDYQALRQDVRINYDLLVEAVRGIDWIKLMCSVSEKGNSM